MKGQYLVCIFRNPLKFLRKPIEPFIFRSLFKWMEPKTSGMTTFNNKIDWKYKQIGNQHLNHEMSNAQQQIEHLNIHCLSRTRELHWVPQQIASLNVQYYLNGWISCDTIARGCKTFNVVAVAAVTTTFQNQPFSKKAHTHQAYT